MNYFNNISHRLFTDHNRLRVVVFMLFASCILAVSLTFFILSIGRPNMGVTLSLSDQYWAVEKVDRNSLASQAGIRKGDRPIEIDGQLAETFLERYSKSGLVFSALFRELTVVDGNGQLKSVSLKENTLPWQGVIQQIAWLFVSVIFWIVGFYVFLKRPRNVASSLLCLIGLFVGLMLISNMAWIAGVSIAAYSEVLATAVGPWLLLHFFFVLPEERAGLRNNSLVYAIYLPAVITLILFTLIGLKNSQPVLWFQNVRYLEAGGGLLAATGAAVFNYFSAVSVRTRQQMKIMAVGCFAALIPFVIFNLFPAAIWRQSILPPEFSILFMGFIPVGMGYAVVTQKLMDIDFFIRRTVIYGLITLVLAAVLSVAIFFVLAYQESLKVPEEILIAIALGSIATILFGPGIKGVEFLLDKFFYKDRYDYRKIIQSLGISLNSIKDLTDVSRLVVGTVVNTLNLVGGCLFVKSRSNSFQISAAQGTFIDTNTQNELLTLISQHNHAIEFPNKVSTTGSDLAYLIPLVTVKEEIGFLCVSQKASRQDFSSDDIFLLQGISFTASLELHSAMLINDVSIRDTFISVASHELRTPLTSIIGYADLLTRRNPADTTKKQWAKRILDSGQRLTAIVDDLLNVSRIQSGKVGITLEKVKLSEVIEEVLFLVKENTDKHEFIVDIEPDLPVVLIDRDKLGQVIGNLLSNAIKYSPYGGRITLSVHNEPDKHQLVISIADEGIGISPGDKESLFKTFHRIKRPETQGVRGSGLGLYIAKEWTEAMGGKIWLESELNKGSTFFVAIPTLTPIAARDKTISIRGNNV